MKLSDNTLEILRNFASINNGIRIRKGSVISTINGNKTILASARVEEKFPVDFAIYDLNRLLAKVSLYEECELEYQSDRLIFKSTDGKRSDSMKYASPQVIVTPPEDKKLELNDPDNEFTLSKVDLKWIRKSAGISGSTHLLFIGDGKKIYIQCTDVKDDSSDVSSVEVADTDKVFKSIIKIDNIKILDDNYTVKLSSRIAKFESIDRSLEYFIAVESEVK